MNWIQKEKLFCIFVWYIWTSSDIMSNYFDDIFVFLLEKYLIVVSICNPDLF